jgi:hypothetical protein
MPRLDDLVTYNSSTLFSNSFDLSLPNAGDEPSEEADSVDLAGNNDAPGELVIDGVLVELCGCVGLC